jgi:two-component system response regulator HydG
MTHFHKDAKARVRVLIVDDEASARHGLEILLRDDGYVVESAKDGEAALAWTIDHPPDVVVTDLQMPKLNGLGLVKLLHDRDPDLPVIVCTAFSDVSTAVAAMRAGADQYLTKPIDYPSLTVAIERALARRDLRRETKKVLGELKGAPDIAAREE